MINKRLVIGQMERFHFSWMNDGFRAHFRDVVVTSDAEFPVCDDDVLFVNAYLVRFHKMKCRHKFGIMYPGFGFHPLKRPEQFDELKPVFAAYDAIFCNEGPVWESVKRDGTCGNFYVVPYCIDTNMFRKTRVRDRFRRIIQVAGKYEYKGRAISRASMMLMPPEWSKSIIPDEDSSDSLVPFSELPSIYQNADGFLQPNMIGQAPGYFVDAKYTAATCEAGLSGCLVFWHDAMGLGCDYETVFEVSLDPAEIATRVQDVVSSIDLDKHSTRTADEFREKCRLETAVLAKVEKIKSFL